MTTSHEPEGRRIAEDGTQESPEGPVEGGRSSYGPGNSGGRQEPGNPVPPYEGRKESAEVQDGPTYREGARVGGATGPVQDDQMKADRPEDTPGGRTTSPVDEQSVNPEGGDADDEGSSEVGSHEAGVPRGEDASGSESGREHIGHEGTSQRPAGTSSARDTTGVDPQEPITTPPERSKG